MINLEPLAAKWRRRDHSGGVAGPSSIFNPLTFCQHPLRAIRDFPRPRAEWKNEYCLLSAAATFSSRFHLNCCIIHQVSTVKRVSANYEGRS